jgi:hypothetical protein
MLLRNELCSNNLYDFELRVRRKLPPPVLSRRCLAVSWPYLKALGSKYCSDALEPVIETPGKAAHRGTTSKQQPLTFGEPVFRDVPANGKNLRCIFDAFSHRAGVAAMRAYQRGWLAMRRADDECCGAHTASSERAGRTVPRHALRAIGRQQQPPRPSSKQRCMATSEHSGEQCSNYAMTGKGVCRMHGGATPVGRKIWPGGISILPRPWFLFVLKKT